MGCHSARTPISGYIIYTYIYIYKTILLHAAATASACFFIPIRTIGVSINVFQSETFVACSFEICTSLLALSRISASYASIAFFRSARAALSVNASTRLDASCIALLRPWPRSMKEISLRTRVRLRTGLTWGHWVGGVTSQCNHAVLVVPRRWHPVGGRQRVYFRVVFDVETGRFPGIGPALRSFLENPHAVFVCGHLF